MISFNLLNLLLVISSLGKNNVSGSNLELLPVILLSHIEKDLNYESYSKLSSIILLYNKILIPFFCGLRCKFVFFFSLQMGDLYAILSIGFSILFLTSYVYASYMCYTWHNLEKKSFFNWRGRKVDSRGCRKPNPTACVQYHWKLNIFS